jgi:hypothetical protein
MNKVLTAKYTAAYKGITVTFFDDGTANFTTYGEVSDDDLNAAISAEGGEIGGYVCNIEI